MQGELTPQAAWKEPCTSMDTGEARTARAVEASSTRLRELDAEGAGRSSRGSSLRTITSQLVGLGRVEEESRAQRPHRRLSLQMASSTVVDEPHSDSVPPEVATTSSTSQSRRRRVSLPSWCRFSSSSRGSSSQSCGSGNEREAMGPSESSREGRQRAWGCMFPVKEIQQNSGGILELTQYIMQITREG